MSDPRPSGPFGIGGLTKNSSIPVTIDDLNEGLIVVSFLHRDNLFQGVLLQLNRERGIPAGISFPKDYCTGEGRKETEKDPSQVPPLNQRQTYFQDSGNVPRSLRRVIKPPARYKNSRMSLRPVQRPVLCAKCGSRCEEEKVLPEATNNEVEHTDKKRKKNGGSTGIPTKKIHTKASKSEAVLSALKSYIPVVDNPILPIIDDPKDFNYESIGTRGILDNVWRRPLAKPLKYQNKNISVRSSTPEQFQNKVTSNGGGKVPLKPVSNKSISSTVTSFTNEKTSAAFSDINNIRSVPNNDRQNNLTLSHLLETKPLVPPPLFCITRSPLLTKSSSKVSPKNKKAHNLKLCISKLASAKTFQDDYYGSESSHISIDSVPNSSDADSSSGVSSNAISEEQNSDTESKDGHPKGTKGRVRKRNATVPLRFRDQSSVAKDIVNLKKIKELPEPQPLLKVKVSKKMCEGFPGQPQYQIHEYLADGHKIPIPNPIECLNNATSFPFRCVRLPECSNSGSVEGTGTGEIQISKSSTKQIEPAKTPVIKITFGSSGNGMVVEIPPKTTQQIENNNILESKAARRAMKKAKKEARKKHLICSTEPSTDDALSLHTIHPITIHIPISAETSKFDESEFIGDFKGFPSLESSDQTSSVPKKRKKEKKKKKERDHKGDDLGISSNSRSQVTAIRELSSSSLDPMNEEECVSSTSNPFPIPDLEAADVGVASIATTQNSPDHNNKQTEADQKLYISLKRLATDAYDVPWNSPTNKELDSVSESTENVEPHDFPVNGVFNEAEKQGATESLESYNHEQSKRTYKKGDVVWGKSLGCPWWPGKIVDILFREAEDVRAKVAWYKSTSQSFIKFSDLCPFDEFFYTKYTKSRTRGSYQQAVRDALRDVESKAQVLTH